VNRLQLSCYLNSHAWSTITFPGIHPSLSLLFLVNAMDGRKWKFKRKKDRKVDPPLDQAWTVWCLYYLRLVMSRGIIISIVFNLVTQQMSMPGNDNWLTAKHKKESLICGLKDWQLSSKRWIPRELMLPVSHHLTLNSWPSHDHSQPPGRKEFRNLSTAWLLEIVFTLPGNKERIVT